MSTRHGRTGDNVKRGADIIVAGAGLAVLFPLLLALGVAVRTSSRGPVFYRGWRTGRDGVPFRIYKFRSMLDGAESLGTTTHVHDARVTRVGALLRRWKLDELPQLLNVLAGEMSFVGPRPEVEEHTAAYSAEEREILSVRPGITDLASIRFVRLAEELGTEDPHRVYVTRVRAEKNALRLRYVRERSLAGDFRIVLSTLRAIASRAPHSPRA
ncbi:MAG: sugar transferase [Gemmatimonadaceae bacterium]